MEGLIAVAIKICEVGGFVKNSTVCPSIVTNMGNIVVPVFADSIFSSDFVCAYTLKVCDSPTYTTYDVKDYVKRVIDGKPDVIKNNDYVDKLYDSIKGENRKTLKIVQISDPHVDFKYTPGTISQCNMPLCCRPENGFTTDHSIMAQEWGNYRCDLPYKTLKHMLEFVRDDIKPDMFIWNGDNSAHNVWDNTEQEVIDYTVNVTNLIKDVLGKENISIYPI